MKIRIQKFLDRFLHRYDDDEYTSKLKARFIFSICVSNLVVIPIIIIYSMFIQLHDPEYHYSIDWVLLSSIFGAMILVAAYTVVLVRGHFRVASHGLLTMLMALVWMIMFLDRSDPVTRLDTIILVAALLTVTPLAVTKFPFTILIYAAANTAVLFIYVNFQHSRLHFSYVTYYDYLFDNIIAIILISIFSYNVFMINKRALEQSDRQKKILTDMNEDLHTMNDMLKTAHERSSAEIQLAGLVQKSMFPKEPPPSVGWDTAFVLKPASSVSGDFYDFYYEDRRLHGISLFDVSGHGVAAGLITMIAKPILQRMFALSEKTGLSRMMDRVSDELFKEIKSTDTFITGIVIRFREEYAEFVNAGHHDLLMKKAGTGSVKPVAPHDRDYRSTPMGMTFGKPEFKTVRFSVERGDILCLVTDGIVEGRNPGREKYGNQRLIQSLQDAPMGSSREVLDHIVRRFEEFMGDAVPHDDYVIIVAKKDR